MKIKKHIHEIFVKDEQQDFVIDAIRALSVLSIIAFHVLVGIIQAYDHLKAKEFILSLPVWLQPLWHGEKGVDAFFLLSGLLIGLSFFKNINNYNLYSALLFLKKKFIRIYPLFLVALGLYTIGQWSYFGKYFLSNLFFVNNLIPGERTIIPVGWFLTVEVQYFFLIPFLFLLLKYIKKRGLLLTALFISSVAACAFVLYKNNDLYVRPITDLFMSQDRSYFSNQMGHLFYESNLTRYGPFIAGILLAYIKTFYSIILANFFKKNLLSWVVIATALLFILTPTMIPIYDPTSWFYRPFSRFQNFWLLTLSRQTFALGIMLLILGCWYSSGPFKLINRIFSWGFWRFISRLSFPIYLFHFPFIAVSAVLVFRTTNIKEIVVINLAQGAAVFLLSVFLTTLFSIPLHVYIEKKLIKKFRN